MPRCRVSWPASWLSAALTPFLGNPRGESLVGRPAPAHVTRALTLTSAAFLPGAELRAFPATFLGVFCGTLSLAEGCPFPWARAVGEDRTPASDMTREPCDMELLCPGRRGSGLSAASSDPVSSLSCWPSFHRGGWGDGVTTVFSAEPLGSGAASPNAYQNYLPRASGRGERPGKQEGGVS